MMYEQLKLLLDLQEIDENLDSLEILKGELPLEIENLESQFLDKKRLLSESETELNKAISDRVNNDLELKSVEEDLEKHRQRRDEAATPKQLKAVEREMESISKKKDELEETIIRLMEKVDELEPIVKGTREKVGGEEKDFTDKKSGIEMELKGVENELAKNKKMRTRLLPSIREDFLSRYEMIRETKKGLAIADVVNGACSGCHTMLPAQIAIDVRGGKEIRLCRNFGRMLFSSESLDQDSDNEGK